MYVCNLVILFLRQLRPIPPSISLHRVNLHATTRQYVYAYVYIYIFFLFYIYVIYFNQ